jgi:putative methyltransferase (TIGR04325 family)
MEYRDGGRAFKGTLAALGKQILPPVLASLVSAARKRAVNRGKAEWEYLPDYPRSDARSSAEGWNVEAVAEKQSSNWSAFLEAVEGTNPLGIAHEAPLPLRQSIAAHNIVLTYGYVLARAARLRPRLSVLDWGGGVGHYYVLARSLLPDLELDYHCKEVPLLCSTGRELLPQVTFHDSDQTAFSRTYDLVLASGALQFADDWRAVLDRMCAATGGYLYITRLPVVDRAASYGLLQRAHRYGYATEYAGWVFNRSEFLAAAEAGGVTLVREFIMEEGPTARNVPERARHGGFLFRRPGTDDFPVV